MLMAKYEIYLGWKGVSRASLSFEGRGENTGTDTTGVRYHRFQSRASFSSVEFCLSGILVRAMKSCVAIDVYDMRTFGGIME